MFNSTQDKFPISSETDALTLRLRGLKDKVHAPGPLAEAVITGLPYRPRTAPSIHVKRFTKAVAAYAVGVALLLGGIVLGLRLLDGSDPVGNNPSHSSVPPVVTSATDVSDDPAQTTDEPEPSVPVPVDENLTFKKTDDGTYAVTGYIDQNAVEIVIPDAYNGIPVTEIRYESFSCCTKLERITIPDTVTKIGANAFEHCISLKEIALPAGLTEIGNDAFYNSGLVSISIPGSVGTIGTGAFSYSESLTTVVLGEGTMELEDSAFESCTALTSITLPSSLRIINEGVFRRCTSLEEIRLPEGLYKIDNFAFEETGLRSITLPDSVSTLNIDVFYGCTALETATLPSGLRWINSGLFAGCTSLKSITIPDTVEVIYDRAFYSCSSLETITIPKQVRTIEESTFWGCSGLESAIFEEPEGWGVRSDDLLKPNERIELGILDDPAENAVLLADTYSRVDWSN